MSELYPLKFEPLLKDKVWGGYALERDFNKKADGLPNIRRKLGIIVCRKVIYR